jgi:hypothetical protein
MNTARNGFDIFDPDLTIADHLGITVDNLFDDYTEYLKLIPYEDRFIEILHLDAGTSSGWKPRVSYCL